jgi:chromosome segregation ATPase
VDLTHPKADTLAPTEEEFVMALAARKIEAEFQMQEPTGLEKKVDRVQEDVAVLKADVKVLQSDVDHLKKDVTRIDAKVDAIGASLTEHRLETEKSIGNLRVEMRDSIGQLRSEMKDEFAKLRAEMKESFEKLRDRRFTLVAFIVGTVTTCIGTTVAALKFFVAA